MLLPLAFVAAHMLTPRAPTVVRPASNTDRNALRAAVDKANRSADASCAQAEAACHAYFRELRSARRLKAFVEELRSWQQKLQLGRDWWNNASSQAQIGRLFARHVAAERDVAQALAELARDYQNLLAAQDYALLTAAGVDAKEAKRAIAKLDVAIPTWNGMFDQAIQQALFEARQDIARTAATIAASNTLTQGLRGGARRVGLDTTTPGSWKDVLTGAALELGVNALVERAFDPTDSIVASLVRRMENAEPVILNGPSGLIPCLRKMRDAHQAARREWLLSTSH
ncbi:MAG: hypothetical protein U0836_23970 [Pirellulales bacterium]